MADTPDCGSPIAYTVLEVGVPVYAADGSRIGTVKHVLFVPEEDVFDGVVIRTDAGERFVDASDVDRIFERCLQTTLTAEQARQLPPPEPAPPVYEDDPALGSGRSLRDFYLRLFRKGGWMRERSGEQEMADEDRETR